MQKKQAGSELNKATVLDSVGVGTDGGQHFPLLLVVHAAEQLAFFQHELITSLQPALTLAAAEAAQVVHLAQHAHYQLGATNHLQAGAALPHKQPAGTQSEVIHVNDGSQGVERIER